jgi:carboxylesterase
MTVETGIVMPGGKAGVLLLHDLGAPACELRPLADHFNEAGFTVALPQIAAGAGAGPVRMTGSALIGEAETALARLKDRCTDVLIAGVSYGGMLGLEIARQHSSAVQAVVLVEPRAWLPGVAFPFRDRLSVHVRQAWLADLAARFKELARRGEPIAAQPLMGLASSRAFSPSVEGTLFGAGQILDCLHATLPAIRQPVLIARRQAAPRNVLDTSILLQRRLGGRVETAIVDAGRTEENLEAGFQADLAERGARFLGAVMDEVTTRRDNEQRRQRASAGRSNAA